MGSPQRISLSRLLYGNLIFPLSLTTHSFTYLLFVANVFNEKKIIFEQQFLIMQHKITFKNKTANISLVIYVKPTIFMLKAITCLRYMYSYVVLRSCF